MKKIVAIKSMVVTCYTCGAWLGRAPVYYSEGDKGDFCHKCSGTAVRVRDGRPFGPKHKDWEWMLKECEELIAHFQDDPYWAQEMEDAVIRR